MIYIVESANILGIFPIYSKSHHSINQVILKSLAARGHNVTIFSYFESKESLPNFTEVTIADCPYPYVDSVSLEESYRYRYVGLINNMKNAKETEFSACRQLFESPQMKKILETKQVLHDVIIAEMYYSHCYNLLAYEMNVPLIFINPIIISPTLDHMIGNTKSLAAVPSTWTSSHSTHMSFLERAWNVVQYATIFALYYYTMSDEMEPISEKYFLKKLPSAENLHRQVALTFYNNHFTLINRPAVPNAIDVAGIHIQESNPLPPVSTITHKIRRS